MSIDFGLEKVEEVNLDVGISSAVIANNSNTDPKEEKRWRQI